MQPVSKNESAASSPPDLSTEHKLPSSLDQPEKKAETKWCKQTNSNVSPEANEEDANLVVKGDIFKGAERFLKKASSGMALGLAKRSTTSKSKLSFLSRDFTQVKVGSAVREDEVDGMTQERLDMPEVFEKLNFAKEDTRSATSIVDSIPKIEQKIEVNQPSAPEDKASHIKTASDLCEGDSRINTDACESQVNKSSLKIQGCEELTHLRNQTTFLNQPKALTKTSAGNAFDFFVEHETSLATKRISFNKDQHINDEVSTSSARQTKTARPSRNNSKTESLDLEEQPSSARSKKRKALSDEVDERGDSMVEFSEKVLSHLCKHCKCFYI